MYSIHNGVTTVGLLLAWFTTLRCSQGFLVSKRRPTFRASACFGADTNTELDHDFEARIRSMKVKEIKAELSRLNISTQDVFEKEDLVKRLLDVRKNGQNFENIPQSESSSTVPGAANVVIAPLYFTNLDSDLKVAAVNINGGIQVEPSDQPYATIEFEVFPDNGGAPFPLRLLLDTACSGFVLRPSVVERYNLQKLSTPVTMTGAGGTVGATGLTQLSRYSLGGETFGSLPAAVQDIGALPAKLDGIVGLSFLNNFKVVDLDFTNGKTALYKKESSNPPDMPSGQSLVARGTMELVPQLGIYTVDVMLGSRGPVKMLVDSGAANSFLNWKGVGDLGLSRDDSSFLQRLPNPMGAMGSDNIAMQLTHRLRVSSFINLGSSGSCLPGLSLKESKRLQIDIGDIAILETMKGQNVGGILGIDALMRAKRVRLILAGTKKEILLYQ